MKFPKSIQNLILSAVDQLFERLKARYFGPDPRKRYALGGKKLTFNHKLTAPTLYEAVGRETNTKSNHDTLAPVLKVAEAYIDAVKEKTKARALNEVTTFVNENPKTDYKTALGGKLSEIYGEAHHDIKRIVETETQLIHNVGVLEAAGKVFALKNLKEPIVFWVCVHDSSLCKECARLHLLPDGITPRVWLQSEVGAGYHKRGDPNPKMILHPNDRCVMSFLLPGFGFDGSGKITYVGPEHNEFAKQRKA
jgi:hypothetical protein